MTDTATHHIFTHDGHTTSYSTANHTVYLDGNPVCSWVPGEDEMAWRYRVAENFTLLGHGTLGQRTAEYLD